MEDIAIVYLIQYAHLRLHALRKFAPHVTLKFVLKSSHRLWKSLIWWPLSFKNVVFFLYSPSMYLPCIVLYLLDCTGMIQTAPTADTSQIKTCVNSFREKKITCFSKVRNFWCVPVNRNLLRVLYVTVSGRARNTLKHNLVPRVFSRISLGGEERKTLRTTLYSQGSCENASKIFFWDHFLKEP